MHTPQRRTEVLQICDLSAVEAVAEDKIKVAPRQSTLQTDRNSRKYGQLVEQERALSVLALVIAPIGRHIFKQCVCVRFVFGYRENPRLASHSPSATTSGGKTSGQRSPATKRQSLHVTARLIVYPPATRQTSATHNDHVWLTYTAGVAELGAMSRQVSVRDRCRANRRNTLPPFSRS